MKIICGLGNPGKDYDKTKHNIGFILLDNYLGDVKWQNKFNALYYELLINDEKIIFIKPLTYMNLSGNAVINAANYYDVKPKDILIIHDDLDLPFGKTRIKKDSGSGGHNGIKSIIECLGTQNFYQLKIGIDNNKNILGKEFVLSKFSKKDMAELNCKQEDYNNIINMFINNEMTEAMNKYN